MVCYEGDSRVSLSLSSGHRKVRQPASRAGCAGAVGPVHQFAARQALRDLPRRLREHRVQLHSRMPDLAEPVEGPDVVPGSRRRSRLPDVRHATGSYQARRAASRSQQELDYPEDTLIG